MFIQRHVFENEMAYCQQTVFRLAIAAYIINRVNLPNKNELITRIIEVAGCHIHAYNIISFGDNMAGQAAYMDRLTWFAIAHNKPELVFNVTALVMQLTDE